MAPTDNTVLCNIVQKRGLKKFLYGAFEGKDKVLFARI